MEDISLCIEVDGSSAAEMTRLTGDLEEWLRRRIDEGEISLSREQKNKEAQDLGTVLVAVLAAPAVVELAKGPILELAKGLADWMRKSRSDIFINGVTVQNVRADDVLAILQKLLEQRKD